MSHPPELLRHVLAWALQSAAGLLVMLAALAGLGIYVVERVRKEIAARGHLTATTVVLVCLLYVGHSSLVVSAAERSLWLLPVAPAATEPIGIALGVLGLALVAAGMLRSGTLAGGPGAWPGSEVSGGVYRWSRNPKNVGWVLMLFGIALGSRSGLALLLVTLFAVSLHLYLACVEEPVLERAFGASYRAYRRRTPRYLGTPASSVPVERERDATSENTNQKPASHDD